MKKVRLHMTDEAIDELWDLKIKHGLNLNNETYEEFKTRMKSDGNGLGYLFG